MERLRLDPDLRASTRERRAHALLNMAHANDLQLATLSDADLLELGRLARKHMLRFGGWGDPRHPITNLTYRAADIFTRRY